MASGVTGKLLHIDLTTRQTRTEELPEAVMRKFLGGGALASYLLLRDMPPGVDPLGPDNVLVLATSVINGLSLSGTNRYTAAAKSPLTGGYGESEAGGWWGPELRAAGWDGLVIRGKAASPVYLWIKDDKVEFRDASRYWGQLSGEVQDGIEQELGDKRVRVLQTGVSGERGVRFAAIVNQLKHFHGRSGLGAVMGAKNLKAVVVRAVGRGEARRGERAAVLGVGALGLLAIQLLKSRGLAVLAIGRTDRREGLARELGADEFTTTSSGRAPEVARSFSGREGVDLLVETAGTGAAVEQAVELVRPGGRLVLTGLPHEPSTVGFFGVVRRELTIIGSMIYQQEFPEAVRLLSAGVVKVDRLVTHRFPLERIQEAFAAHRSPESIKVTVVI